MCPNRGQRTLSPFIVSAKWEYGVYVPGPGTLSGNDLHRRQVRDQTRVDRALAGFVASFTAATRAEEGNLWFEWSRSLDDPAEYVLVESFRDGEAGGVHVNSDHFRQAMRELPKALASTPKIISQTIDATGWSAMGEMTVG